MIGKGFFHLLGAFLERLQQIAMAAKEIFQNVGQLAGGGVRIKSENAFDDMVGSGLVGRNEVARLGCGFERPHDHPGWIRPQVKGLEIQEWNL
jgi:hypothetical protein